MSLESVERAICAALNAADEKVGSSAEALVRDVLRLGANAGTFPVVVDGVEYIVKVSRTGGPLIAHESHQMVDDSKFGGQICKNCGTPPGIRKGWTPCKYAGGEA
ncbi:hypothetical protein [Pseudomonas sp. C9]|uniref:hypothetical protein n=1 Tax=Pseudomonas sp. C9 TaxID=1311337 RepID=UPI00111573DB|nr:hypothetical protein [Pseudomonas sp. C9]